MIVVCVSSSGWVFQLPSHEKGPQHQSDGETGVLSKVEGLAPTAGGRKGARDAVYGGQAMNRPTGWIVAVIPRGIVAAVAVMLSLWPVGASATALGQRVVRAGSEVFPTTFVRLPLARFRVGVALAGKRVGDTAFLLDIAQAAGARCAINGTFFAAYPGETGEPYGTVVIDGKLLHLGGIGTRLDVLADGTIQMTLDRLTLRGTLNGHDVYPDNWYAYNVNQTPPRVGASAYVYTPERGPTIGFAADLSVVAREGRIAGITRGQDVAIPADGFVVALQGKESEILGWKFHIGERIGYQAVQDGIPLRTRFSLGAGPKLVRNGTVSVNPVAEGFRDPKIVSLRGRRSAIGFTTDHEVILAIIDGATVSQAGVVMKKLGAADAMNLDDNASSALVCGRKYLVRPGRRIANALVLWPGL
jgi:phosphodiester glycosidase